MREQVSKDSVDNIADLKFDPKNARRRTERSSHMIRTSLEKFGGMRSIVLDENNIIRAGNGTVEEAGQLGIEKVRVIDADGDEIIAVRRKGLSEAEWKEYAVADNRSSDLSEWDAEVLAELSEEIDLSGLFFEDELAELMDSENVQVDDEPAGEDDEEQVADDLERADSGEIESRVSLGQIWKLGRHYICCGDSTDEGNIQGLLSKAGVDKVGMIWADPPYGIAAVNAKGFVGNSRTNQSQQDAFAGIQRSGKGVLPTKYAPIIGDDTIDTAVRSATVALDLFPNAVQFWWGGNYYASALTDSSCWIVWDKQATGDFADAELAWTNQPTPVRIFQHMWNGLMKASEQGQKRVHPTQKPVRLAEWAFDKYGKPDDAIFDPFLGSGMSIIAAQQMEGSRKVVGFELSSEYCEVICRRFESFCGINAELVGSL